MRLNSIGYYADFFISGTLIFVIVAFVLAGANWMQGAEWAVACLVGAVAWTLIEYSMHRWLYHRVPYFRDLHHLHHTEPKAHIGAPPVIGVALIVMIGFLPLASTSLWMAAGVTTGLLMGFMAYMLVHHASHYWNSAAPSWLYQARRHHSLHHHCSEDANFGITTSFWDHALGTALVAKRKEMNSGTPGSPTLP